MSDPTQSQASDARRQLMQEVFQEAVAAPASSRAELVRARCNGDTELIEEIQSLLQHHHTQDSFLESSPMMVEAPEDRVGTTLAGGRYTILRMVGSGGMGVVYEAEQDSPKRRVALKVMRAAALMPGMLRRFRHEAAALARLQHPGIAQVYEAGGQDGIPFIAMEFVQGRPLNEHVRERALAQRPRLELFLQVCDAVTHAHERGVIHRDLKPANVLVSENDAAKVLDFGVARLSQQDARMTVTAPTAGGQVVGTLSYMSPEQAAGSSDRIDTRTDVYALGVMLYELLCNRLPLDLSRCSIYEGVRRIVDEEPAQIGSLDRSLRGDLETIVTKAIDKEPARRYQSVAALAEDVRRYLQDEPITARPATTWYQFSKFARRNKLLVAAASAVLLALSAGLVGTAWQWMAARREADATRETTAFLMDMLSAVTPERARGREPTMREAIDVAAAKLESGLVKSPVVRASLHAEIGRAYGTLGQYQLAEHHQRRALELEKQLYGETSTVLMERMASITWIMHLRGQDAQAIAFARESLERSRRAFGDRERCTIQLASQLANALPPGPESLALYKEAYENAVASLGLKDEDTMIAMSNYGQALIPAHRLDEAADLTRKCLDLRRRLSGPDHPFTLDTQTNMGAVLIRSGKTEEGAKVLENMIEIQERVLGSSHSKQIADRCNVASGYMEAGWFAKAADLMKRNIAAIEESGIDRPDDLDRSQGLAATCLIKLERFEEAQAFADQLVARATRRFPPSDPGADPPTPVFMTWTVQYDLFQAWSRKDPSKADMFKLWKDRIAATRAGKAALEAEAARGEGN